MAGIATIYAKNNMGKPWESIAVQLLPDIEKYG